MKVLCIYHGNCADGFGAAWALRKYFIEKEPDKTVVFYAGVYQQEPPWDLVDGETDVYLVDFSYKVPVVEALCDRARTVTIIDHHKSAIDDINNIPEDKCPQNLIYYFSINHSGAMLTWQYCFQEEPPQLLKHIEDRDLWKFELPGTREIQANLFSYPYDFQTWDTLMKLEGEALNNFQLQGQAIERKHFKDIHENLNTSVRWMNIGGVEMPVINCPKEWGSDAANILAESASNRCAAYYWDSALGRNFGLRAVDGGPDVSEICKKYGGGGHMKAAGFRCGPLTSLSFEIGETSWNGLREDFCIHNPPK